MAVCLQRPPLSVKTLTMAPGGVETSVFHNTIVPESAQVDFSHACCAYFTTR